MQASMNIRVNDNHSLCRVRYLGVTPPISTSESSPREKEVTATLMEELRKQGIFESEEESKRRYAYTSVFVHHSACLQVAAVATEAHISYDFTEKLY